MTPGVVLAVQDSITSCVPEPESATDCGLPLALSVMLRAAVRVPLAAGVNKIAMVQVPPAATAGLQVSTSVKSVASAPVNVMLEMLKLALPVLLRVTTCEVLTMSTASFPKERLVGERLAAGHRTRSGKAHTLWAAGSVVREGDGCGTGSAAVGLKVTLIVQLAPAATLDPQLLVSGKSLALAPDTVTLVMLRAVLPELVRVIV